MSVYVWLGLGLVAVIVAADVFERGTGYIARRFPAAVHGTGRLLKWGVYLVAVIVGWVLVPPTLKHRISEAASIIGWIVLTLSGLYVLQRYLDQRNDRHQETMCRLGEIIERLDRLERR